MSPTTLAFLGGGWTILTLAPVFACLGATGVPGPGDGPRRGGKETTGDSDGQASKKGPSHPVLVALALIVAAVCLTLVLYEFAKTIQSTGSEHRRPKRTDPASPVHPQPGDRSALGANPSDGSAGSG